LALMFKAHFVHPFLVFEVLLAMRLYIFVIVNRVLFQALIISVILIFMSTVLLLIHSFITDFLPGCCLWRSLLFDSYGLFALS